MGSAGSVEPSLGVSAPGHSAVIEFPARFHYPMHMSALVKNLYILLHWIGESEILRAGSCIGTIDGERTG